MNYDEIKRLAKSMRKSGQNCLVKDLIVLATNNDPFYCGRPSDKELANWLANLWQEFGYTDNVHLRRIHYRIASGESPVLKPNGKPYENTDEDWQLLGIAAKAARYLDLIPVESIIDRRNAEPMVNFVVPDPPEIEIDGTWVSEIYTPDFPDLPDYQVRGLTLPQPIQIEVWCEKSTMNDVLVPICRRHGVNFCTGLGEMSVAQANWAVERAVNANRPTVILYISDFDPAGRSIPVGVARKIEYFVHKKEIDIPIFLKPIILTHDQCREYRLPRIPIKESERRAGAFEDRWGTGATELDALEALHPGALGHIVRTEIKKFWNSNLSDESDRMAEAIREAISTAREETINSHAEEIESLREEFRQLVNRFEAEAEDIMDHYRPIAQEVAEAMRAACPDIGNDHVPDLSVLDEEVWLLDTRREYMDQLASYKVWQTGETHYTLEEGRQ